MADRTGLSVIRPADFQIEGLALPPEDPGRDSDLRPSAATCCRQVETPTGGRGSGQRAFGCTIGRRRNLRSRDFGPARPAFDLSRNRTRLREKYGRYDLGTERYCWPGG